MWHQLILLYALFRKGMPIGYTIETLSTKCAGKMTFPSRDITTANHSFHTCSYINYAKLLSLNHYDTIEGRGLLCHDDHSTKRQHVFKPPSVKLINFRKIYCLHLGGMRPKWKARLWIYHAWIQRYKERLGPLKVQRPTALYCSCGIIASADGCGDRAAAANAVMSRKSPKCHFCFSSGERVVAAVILIWSPRAKRRRNFVKSSARIAWASTAAAAAAAAVWCGWWKLSNGPMGHTGNLLCFTAVADVSRPRMRVAVGAFQIYSRPIRAPCPTQIYRWLRDSVCFDRATQTTHATTGRARGAVGFATPACPRVDSPPARPPVPSVRLSCPSICAGTSPFSRHHSGGGGSPTGNLYSRPHRASHRVLGAASIDGRR